MKNLLLHICCGPCATTTIEQLLPFYNITGYYFNPNIWPESEYIQRLTSARKTCAFFEIPLIEGEYNRKLFIDNTTGLKNEPENGKRCDICFTMRLSETARKAKEGSFDSFTSTLTAGPMKKAAQINPIGKKEAEKHEIEFIEGDWKKKDGYKRAIEISRQLGLYRQNFCGCGLGKDIIQENS
jgi:epoxyqueuosine reductase